VWQNARRLRDGAGKNTPGCVPIAKLARPELTHSAPKRADFIGFNSVKAHQIARREAVRSVNIS
jgi:hypothetical protein